MTSTSWLGRRSNRACRLTSAVNPPCGVGRMRGCGAVLTASGNLDYENATDESHASGLVQSESYRTVVFTIGREMIRYLPF